MAILYPFCSRPYFLCESSKMNQSQLDLSDSNNGTQSNLTVAYVRKAEVGRFKM